MKHKSKLNFSKPNIFYSFLICLNFRSNIESNKTGQTLNLRASLSYGLGVQSTRALALATNGPAYNSAETFDEVGRPENERGMLHWYDGVHVGRAKNENYSICEGILKHSEVICL